MPEVTKPPDTSVAIIDGKYAADMVGKTGRRTPLSARTTDAKKTTYTEQKYAVSQQSFV